MLVLEILLAAVIGVVTWDVFLSDLLKSRLSNFSEQRTNVSNADKIARVKLVSDDARGIEKFITDNASLLSDAMVQQLVARIEAIKTDKVIDADTLLKSRIDDLQEPAPESEPEPVRQAYGRGRGAKKS